MSQILARVGVVFEVNYSPLPVVFPHFGFPQKNLCSCFALLYFIIVIILQLIHNIFGTWGQVIEIESWHVVFEYI